MGGGTRRVQSSGSVCSARAPGNFGAKGERLSCNTSGYKQIVRTARWPSVVCPLNKLTLDPRDASTVRARIGRSTTRSATCGHP